MLKKLLALFAMVSLILTLSLSQAANAAQGEPGPPPGKGEDTTPNSLSVPVINVGSTNAPFTCTTTTATEPVATAENPTWTFPGDFTNPILTAPEEGVVPPDGEYFIQGLHSWQAECGNATAGTLTVDGDWGDNLGGDAKMSAGSPVRVEMGLLVDPAANPDTADMQGFAVLKLTTDLDRYATYGTLGTLADLGEVRAFDPGAELKIYSTTKTEYDGPASAELNSTGRVVYGYNWIPSEAGTYTIEFYAPNVTVKGTTDHTVSITVLVTEGTGSGGGGGGGNGGGGGGKPTLPGSPGGKLSVSLDVDQDRVGNGSDNCREVKNPAQKDKDGDGFGNKCDTAPKNVDVH